MELKIEMEYQKAINLLKCAIEEGRHKVDLNKFDAQSLFILEDTLESLSIRYFMDDTTVIFDTPIINYIQEALR